MGERIVHLEVNELGSWRRVTSFDLADFDDGDLEHAAHALLSLSANKDLRARIVAPHLTMSPTPLIYWDHHDGWRQVECA